MSAGKPEVDAARCIGAGQCEMAAPNTFEVNDEGISEVVDPSGDDPAAIEQAVANCPAQAISLSP